MFIFNLTCCSEFDISGIYLCAQGCPVFLPNKNILSARFGRAVFYHIIATRVNCCVATPVPGKTKGNCAEIRWFIILSIRSQLRFIRS